MEAERSFCEYLPAGPCLFLSASVHPVMIISRIPFRPLNDNSRFTLQKKTFSIDVDIHFVGVWDTVASVGLISRRLPFVKSNTAVKTFRHALSLDERRAKFKPNSYQLATLEERNREGGDFKVPDTVMHAEVATEAAELGRELEEELEEKREEEVKHEKEAEDEREARAERKARLMKEEGEHIMRSASPESTPEATDVETEHDTDDTLRKPEPKKGNTVSHILGGLVHTISGGGSIYRTLSSGSKEGSETRTNSVDSEHERCDRCRRNPLPQPDQQKRHHHRHHKHGLNWDEDEWQTEEVVLKKRLEEMYTDRSQPTDVLEVWFAGCHCGKFTSVTRNIWSFFSNRRSNRCGRWLGQELDATQSGADSITMDDSPVLRDGFWHPVPGGEAARNWP